MDRQFGGVIYLRLSLLSASPVLALTPAHPPLSSSPPPPITPPHMRHGIALRVHRTADAASEVKCALARGEGLIVGHAAALAAISIGHGGLNNLCMGGRSYKGLQKSRRVPSRPLPPLPSCSTLDNPPPPLCPHLVTPPPCPHLVVHVEVPCPQGLQQVRRHDLTQFSQPRGDVGKVGLHAAHAEDDAEDLLLHLRGEGRR